MFPNIAIIGAGPGGLCLANILQRNNISYTVFESDKSPYERNQGGTLDLHPRDGQIAIKEAGLWAEFCRHSRPEADVMKIVNLNGDVLWDGNGADKYEIPEDQRRPEIDRESLRDILLKNLYSDNLRFSMHLQEVMPGDNGKYDLHFRDDTIETGFDLVVGAEGAWSKVRKILTDEKPHYSGISALELWSNDVDETNPWLVQYVGAGSCFCFDEGRAILMQRLGQSKIRVYACVRKPESYLNDYGIDLNEPEKARDQFIEHFFGDIASDLKRVLQCGDKVVPRALYELPVGFNWQHKTGVALVGDAAHVMTPFAGVGVNAALTDARELARSIIMGSATLSTTQFDDAIREYQTESFTRNEKFARKTSRGLKEHFSADGADTFAKKHRDARAALQ